MDGDRIASVGVKGSEPLQFNTPSGIAISPITGQVYIADSVNHRIQVLNLDLTFSHSFGSKGSANGQFNISCDIAIDSQGLVYVTDTDNHRIQKFSPDGKFIAQFGGLPNMNYPVGITIDTTHGLVYITEHCKYIASSYFEKAVTSIFPSYKSRNISAERLLVFTTDGRFLHCISQLFNARGLTLDNKGLLYVCNNKIAIF